ncbi:MAG: DUF4129 domain-containing protein [Myxococcales bacterium]
MSSPTKPRGALETLDRALEIARTQPLSELGLAWLPGALLAWLSVSLYYLERVEGVRSLRPLFALLLVATFALRALVLGRWAGRRAQHELDQSGVRPVLAPASLVVRASLWVGVELWLWLWPVVIVLHVDPWLLPLLLPLWCLRGSIAPSWLAVVNVSGERTGFRAMRAALVHCEGQRGQALACELLLLLGGLALMINVGAGLVLLVTLGQTSLGLDLASVRAFVSPQNHFVLLCVTAFALSLLDPVRAALSSVFYVDAELVREGAGVRTLVARALRSADKQGRAALKEETKLRAGLGVLLCCSLAGSAAPALAQEPTSPGVDEVALEEPAPEDACDESCLRAQERDAALEARVLAILAEPAFAEFPDESWRIDGKGALRRWLERLFDDWFKEASEVKPERLPPGWSWGNLPGSKLFLTLAVVLLMLALAKLAFSGGPRRTTRASRSAAQPEPDPFARSSEDHFADAARLFARDPREALRALYLGALVGLARKDLLQLAPERTNGHYLRQLAGRDQRAPFAELTRTFDAVRYGDLSLDRAAFERCLSLANALVAFEPPGGEMGAG